ncbi:MAG: putative Ig domain-containing protein, partial [Steroidobacteraceae bacterium]
MPSYVTHARAPRVRAAAISLFAVIATFGALAVHAAAPTISGTPPTFLGVNDYYWFQPAASDPDTALSALRYSIVSKPGWASFSTTSGKLYGRPTRAGTWSSIVIKVTDGSATRSLAQFAITASTSAGTTNRAPQISGTPPTSATLNVYYKFVASASDPDGNPLTFSIQNKPAWLTFNIRLGQLSGTARSTSDIGTYPNIVIRVSDGRRTASLPAFSITVKASGSGTTNKPPTISGTPPGTVKAGSLYSFTPSADDADDDSLTFSVANKPSWASFSTTTGRLWG